MVEPRPPEIFSYIQVKAELMFGNQYVSIRLHRCRDGQIGTNPGLQDKNGTNGRPGKLFFVPGHVVKNRDCPGKSGTDGHLTTTFR